MSGKKFHFSLNSVLKLRSHEAECARLDLAAVRQDLRHQQEILEAAEEALRLAVDARRTGSTGQPSLARLEAFRQAAHDRVRTERRKLDRLRDREEEARLILMMRKGAEETMRHLEDDERAFYWKKLRSAEAEQLDEQAITGFHRQRRAASP
jgi:flagellar FliJ protein